MTYAGDLVTLRPLQPGDAAYHHRWFADAEVTRHLTLRYPLALPAVEARVADGARQTFADTRWTVVANDTGEPVGYTALRGATPESRDAELVLVVGERSAWGRGYGTDATRATCAHGFGRLGLHRIHLSVCTDHDAAIRVYERVGFVREGVARDRLYKNGRWHDCLLMALLDRELR